jgi:hypothetical protein
MEEAVDATPRVPVHALSPREMCRFTCFGRLNHIPKYVSAKGINQRTRHRLGVENPVDDGAVTVASCLAPFCCLLRSEKTQGLPLHTQPPTGAAFAAIPPSGAFCYFSGRRFSIDAARRGATPGASSCRTSISNSRNHLLAVRSIRSKVNSSISDSQMQIDVVVV